MTPKSRISEERLKRRRCVEQILIKTQINQTCLQNNQAQSSKAAATFEELKVLKEKEAKLQADIQSLKKDDKGSLKQMKQSLPV